METSESISDATADTSDTKGPSQNIQLSQHHRLRQELVLDRKTTNLESHQMVWVSSSNEVVSLQSLRCIVDYVCLFKNVRSSRAYIQRTLDTVTFLVCSQQFSRILIPKIHHLRHVYLIYVYACDADLETTATTAKNMFSQEEDQQWLSTYKKVNAGGSGTRSSAFDYEFSFFYAGKITEKDTLLL
jgi:hypothetical protein